MSTLQSETEIDTKSIQGRFCCVFQFMGTLENPGDQILGLKVVVPYYANFQKQYSY